MNINNIKHMAKSRLHTTKIGRTLCRLAGEESGQTAMEYVVIATLICAAIAVGIWLFGSQILGMFQSAGDATQGEHEKSRDKITQQRGDKPAADNAAMEADNHYTDDGTAHDAAGNKPL